MSHRRLSRYGKWNVLTTLLACLMLLSSTLAPTVAMPPAVSDAPGHVPLLTTVSDQITLAPSEEVRPSVQKSTSSKDVIAEQKSPSRAQQSNGSVNSAIAALSVSVTAPLSATIQVAPAAFDETLAAGTAATRTLTITNNGDSSLLWNASASAGSAVDDFDPDIDPAQWSTINSGWASTNCDAVNGNALYFDGDGLRQATSQATNVLSGGTLGFYLRIGTGGAPCEDADSGEDVLLQYSTDGGTIWNTIDTYNVDAYPTFTLIQKDIPDSARTDSTWFRWIQPTHSGSGYDNWAIDNVKGPVGFVALFPISGTVAVGASTPVSVTLNATDLISGTYPSSIVIQSNDPLTSQVAVPVTLTVLGMPTLVVTPTVLDFGTVYVGLSRTLTFTLTNTGTADLSVTAIGSSHPDVNVAFTDTVLAPGDATVVPVTFAPISAGAISATLTIASNAGMTAMPTSGTGLLPPVIQVTPSVIEETVAAGMIVTRAMTITNSGGSDLNWDLQGINRTPTGLDGSGFVNLSGAAAAPKGTAAAGGPSRPDSQVIIQPHRSGGSYAPKVLLLNADDDNSYGSPIQTLLQAYGDLGDVDLYDARYGTPSLEQLQTYDVVVTWSNFYYANSIALGDVLADYVDAGGRVVVLMFALGTHSVQMQGRFMDEQYVAANGGNYVSSTSCLGAYDAAHPIFQDVTHVCDYYRLSGTYLTPNSTAIAYWQDGNIFVGVKDRLPVVSIAGYVGYYYAWSGQMTDVLHNSINFLANSWLAISPTAGTVPAYSSSQVMVTLDATDLISDTYRAYLVVSSNDPFAPTVNVPVTLTVIGTPLLTVTPAALDFGAVYVGVSRTLPLTLTNTGTADLHVTGIAGSRPDFSASFVGTLPPRHSTVVSATFAPSVAGLITGTLTVSHDAGVTAVLVNGNGSLRPAIQVTPTAIAETAAADSIVTRTLTIGNDGDGELSWSLISNPSASIEASNTPLSQITDADSDDGTASGLAPVSYAGTIARFSRRASSPVTLNCVASDPNTGYIALK